MHRIETKPTRLPMKPSLEVFRNEQGVIDLASIMVGVIVIGMIGGVIAATVFAVIPWAQDAAAKQQLDNIVTAESAYMGYSAATPSLLPAEHQPTLTATPMSLKQRIFSFKGKLIA